MATERVLSFTEARSAVERIASALLPSLPERVSLTRAAQRVLAQDIVADRDLPPFPRSTRDGFAVRAADLLHPPVRLRVLGEISAGLDPASVLPELPQGSAVEIMTGASLPAGADAVVMVEYTSRIDGTTVEVQRSALPSENVVAIGSEAHAGDVLLKSGTPLDYAALATAASVGRAEISVFARPRVAILSTGNELVDIATQPGQYQIRNSNSYSLAAQVEAAGGHPVILPIAPDEPESLLGLLLHGLRYDLLLITGGVSMGKHDLVEPALMRIGARFHFTGAAIQPGKPIVFGEVPNESVLKEEIADQRKDQNARITIPFFGLPGNPVSTMVCFELFVGPVLDALRGATPRPLLFTQARLASHLKTKTGLTRFLPAVLSGALSDTQVDLVRWQGSGDVVATARANCYIVVPPDRETIAAGEYVSILLRGAEL